MGTQSWTCGNCVYFEAGGRCDGFCHRYPPTLYHCADDSTNAFFPPVYDDDYCGEWLLNRTLKPSGEET